MCCYVFSTHFTWQKKSFMMIDDNTVEVKCQEFISSLQQIRQQKGLSTGDLAELTGLRKGNIERIEAGAYKPNLETIMRITDALGVDLIVKK